jgi:Ca2+-binding EF-hand superfamily protein|uniref:EF-hand domain-containing family member C2 n=1 Tax=Eutreptiella gymnastica TaxID=73025 RepID=A0A7S4D451_9EUGL|mmetsp:Transcript_9921/g.18747  ORF Transcript_9921/g.18747 Transcript_9921/m.18747 type:complete len:790 (-) Transcript_9921:370-2739(-)|eukprot:CAMPEP_0174302598 /NCGR_PEP_ID=MMETSP0809-20121228/59702_1 /TAXON_ID=73025 ORGANISM="Eutreptiella gymnastica-like, Strain CCMP1594" /NCGR_SAMPLE_ID=MMETSP0809 /ASSEMBLY_ACC=CAM_ASM_000658 /LENGTH=789 /DNA_ID=CAMNT_0015408515 /DNA_START=125 /DNA_END=2494 /DNA_ORIENTATION=+
MTAKLGYMSKGTFAPHEKNIPMLPGNNFHDDPLLRRGRATHTLDIKQGTMVAVSTIEPTYQPPAYKRIEHNVDVPQRETTPPWLTQHNVLRFNAYYLEPIVESAIETVRLRKCVVYFHTEDNTVLVRELPQPNAGMSQGVLIRRHCIPVDPSEKTGTDNEMIGVAHLNVGVDVTLYGKRFHICDVDSNTRNHLEAMGVAVPANEGWPEGDQFAAYLAKKARRVGTLTAQDLELKRHHEYGTAGRVSMVSPERIQQAKRFYQANGRVLTFLAGWDDRDRPHGDLRLMQINYYLEDATIQVLEPPVTNSGREECKKTLVRQRIPRKSPDNKPAFKNESLLDHLKTDAHQHNTFGVNMDGGYLTEDDLGIGRVLDIHGKTFVLYDCDERTRKYYLQEKGVDLGASMDIMKYFNIVPKKIPRAAPPPHDGIGSEEDSLGNWQGLLMKPPKRDHVKWVKNDGKILTFALRMVASPNAVIEEESRHFILSFWLEDDSLQITEISSRNSGIMGGKYLARQKVKQIQPDGSSKYLQAEDFQVGEIIELYSKKFRILQMDRNTEKLLSGIEDPSSPEDIKKLIVVMRENMVTKYPRVQEAFHAVGGHINNCVDLEDLIKFFRTMNLECKREDAKTILNMFDNDRNGTLDFNEFVGMVLGDEHSLKLDVLANSTRAIRLAPEDTFTQYDAHVQDNIELAHTGSLYKKQAKNTLEMFRDKIHQRRMGTIEVFRLLNGSTPNALMGPESFRRGLKDILHMLLKEEEIRVLEDIFFPNGQLCTLQHFSVILESPREAVMGFA